MAEENQALDMAAQEAAYNAALMATDPATMEAGLQTMSPGQANDVSRRASALREDAEKQKSQAGQSTSAAPMTPVDTSKVDYERAVDDRARMAPDAATAQEIVDRLAAREMEQREFGRDAQGLEAKEGRSGAMSIPEARANVTMGQDGKAPDLDQPQKIDASAPQVTSNDDQARNTAAGTDGKIVERTERDPAKEGTFEQSAKQMRGSGMDTNTIGPVDSNLPSIPQDKAAGMAQGQ